jgi:hypothetical protein
MAAKPIDKWTDVDIKQWALFFKDAFKKLD